MLGSFAKYLLDSEKSDNLGRMAILLLLWFNVPLENFPVMLGVFTSNLGNLKCLAQGHYTATMGYEPGTSRSIV